LADDTTQGEMMPVAGGAADELLARVCDDLRRLRTEAGGPSLRTLADKVGLGKSQLGPHGTRCHLAEADQLTVDAPVPQAGSPQPGAARGRGSAGDRGGPRAARGAHGPLHETYELLVRPALPIPGSAVTSSDEILSNRKALVGFTTLPDCLR